jgi:hypothetical protein
MSRAYILHARIIAMRFLLKHHFDFSIRSFRIRNKHLIYTLSILCELIVNILFFINFVNKYS